MVKLKNFAQNIEYNLDQGKKTFTIEIGEGIVKPGKFGKLPSKINASLVTHYGQLELKIEDFPNLNLKGELAKPSDPLQNNCP
jgi:hypothetical protein